MVVVYTCIYCYITFSYSVSRQVFARHQHYCIRNNINDSVYNLISLFYSFRFMLRKDLIKLSVKQNNMLFVKTKKKKLIVIITVINAQHILSGSDVYYL